MDDPSVQHTFLHEVDLTDRQMEVLRLKADRRTNAEIAEKLVITLTTVKWHVRQIYNKLGANNRAEAVASARQLGLLEKGPEHPKGTFYNFPTPLTYFVGRESEIRQIISTLTDPDTRLVTLLGPGGIGKTRLALQAAGSLDAAFPDGICWVPFPALDQAELVFTTIDEYIAENIYTAFGLTRQGTEEYTQLLVSFLKNRQALVVLDSFEILISGANSVSNLLTETSACKFMVTSRERLNLPGEVLYHILGLRHSQDSENSQPADAVNLFLQEASRVSQSDLDYPEVLPAIQRICSRLEGMPLAITLAAEWSRLLPIDAIEQELERGLEFLDAGSTSIRSVFDRSWNLLTDQQQVAFTRLAVFQRGFTRESAQKVAGADLETLSALFDKSLIQQMGESRYTIHDLLRQYAIEHLQARDDWESTRDAHCTFFARLVADQLVAIMSGDHSKILADLDNIRAAWRWAVKRKRLADLHRMVFPLDWFYNLRALYSEGIAVMGLAIDALRTESPHGLQGIVYAKALIQYGLERTWVHGTDQNAESILEGIKILRSLDCRKDLAWPLILAIFEGHFKNDPQTREQYCRESLEIFKELDNPHGVAFALAVLSSHYRKLDQLSDAQQSIEHSLEISRSIGDQEGIALALHNLGDLFLHRGNFEAAHKVYAEEAHLWGELALLRSKNEAIQSQANTALAAGNLKEAEQLYLESLAEFEQLDDPGNALTNLFGLTRIALKRENLQEAHDLLQDARLFMENRQDSEEQARWWLLSGRIDLHQGNADAAHSAFCQALEYSTKVGNTALIQTLLDFASYYQQQLEYDLATLLLGFAKNQNGLSTVLVQGHIDPLQASLAVSLDKDSLSALMDKGATLDQQELVERLLAECG
ncbi:MAG: tetratricopeptide repeat protein [Anaerolineales bacterium]